MVGVGGMGMAPLAVYLAKDGHDVCGYDDSLPEAVRCILERSGVRISKDMDGLDDTDILVHSSAIQPTHTILKQAREMGVRTMRRGEMLARQMQGKRLVAVVGSHGKTTTAHMLAHLLKSNGVEAAFIGGGLFNDDSLDPAWNADSNWIVAEIDESDGSIEHFSPEITLLTNFDWDHPDQYSNEDQLRKTFGRLFSRTHKQILLPFCQAEQLMDFLPEQEGPSVHFFGEQGDYEAEFSSETTIPAKLQLGGCFPESTVSVAAKGRFNLHNALAALAVAHCMGLRKCSTGLEGFEGVHRRQSILYDSTELSVLADYAHHPTEIGALLDSARSWYPNRNLVVVFQPHRFSRTAQFREAFGRALGKADELIVLPVYSAGEKSRKDGVSSSLQKLIPQAEFLYWMPGRGRLHRMLKEFEKPSAVLFIGAGSVDRTARLFGAVCRNRGRIQQEWMDYLRPQVSPESRLRLDETLKTKTTLKIGGKARFYAEPGSMEDLLQVMECAAMFGLPHYVLGRGSNLIVPDDGFPGVVLRLSRPFWRQVEILDGGRMRVGGGSRLGEVANRACTGGISGFEFMEGIPGSIGGALRMNAGAMGSWILDLVEEIVVMHADGKIETLGKDQFCSGYRRCSGLEGKLALSAILKSPDGDTPESIRSRMRGFAKRRRTTQPRESSAGCIFKNPQGYYAGLLIEDAGLKGKRIGGAEVSTVHGNFIVNVEDARYGDVVKLVRTVREEVQAAHKLELVPEVELLGTNWDKIL